MKEIAAFQSETATVNGIGLHYWIGGDPAGTPVLLWHGFLGTAYSWHKVMALLSNSGYTVLVPDMRGYGDSDKPAGTSGYDGRAFAGEFRSLVKQLDFRAGPPAYDRGSRHGRSARFAVGFRSPGGNCRASLRGRAGYAPTGAGENHHLYA